jgi:hypothetical protein
VCRHFIETLTAQLFELRNIIFVREALELSVNCERIKGGFFDAVFLTRKKESKSSACFEKYSCRSAVRIVGIRRRLVVPGSMAHIIQRVV